MSWLRFGYCLVSVTISPCGNLAVLHHRQLVFMSFLAATHTVTLPSYARLTLVFRPLDKVFTGHLPIICRRFAAVFPLFPCFHLALSLPSFFLSTPSAPYIGGTWVNTHPNLFFFFLCRSYKKISPATALHRGYDHKGIKDLQIYGFLQIQAIFEPMP